MERVKPGTSRPVSQRVLALDSSALRVVERRTDPFRTRETDDSGRVFAIREVTRAANVCAQHVFARGKALRVRELRNAPELYEGRQCETTNGAHEHAKEERAEDRPRHLRPRKM